MTTNRSSVSRRSTAPGRSWWAMPVACLATVLALPVNAGIVVPDDPLTTAARVAPNTLFILDDSGSMAFDYMPDDLPNDWRRQSHAHNAVYYNPATTYQPWVRADGERMTGGTSYSSAYGSFNLVGGGTINLGSASSCRRFNYNNNATTDELASGGTNVCGGEQVFYVPKFRLTGPALNQQSNFYRYTIQDDASGGRVMRSEWGTVTTSAPINASGFPRNGLSGALRTWTRYSFVVPAGARNLTITMQGGSGDPDLYLRFGSQPDTNSWDCRPYQGAGATETCTVANPQAGTYHVGIYAYSAFSNVNVSATYVNDNRCGTGTGTSDWINCTEMTPTGRTAAEEKANFATWFSYHRTRMKAAKAGASEAFASVDGKVRVGFRTIWDRAGSRFDIPVNDGNDGRFVDASGTLTTNSRSTWYSRLHSVIGYNGTPLHSALDGAGAYFSSSAANGPYGPQASNQYSCRQNFAILTTDGYWNSVTIDVGNQDGTSGSRITGPNGQSYTYSASAPYTDGISNTLADVAMKYWKADLRTDLTNNVPTTTANPAFWQHMVTFGISIGLSGRKGWSSVAEVPANATWNDPTDAEDADRIDDLLHAAVNGRGAFVSASNPAEFTQGLSGALAAIAQRTSSYSNVATNSVSLDTGSQVFSASYVSGIWTGTVQARSVGRNGVSDNIAWTATTPAWSNRKIFTSSASSVGVPGSTGASFPSTVQEAALARTGGRANFEVTGEENARYLKGKSDLESRNGGTLRNRTSIIGDIVGSSPAYVKDTNTLYVGANDGMLHAFNATTGVELFAYVPNILNFNALSTLSRGDYAHKFFVDGPVVVSSRRLTPERNILVATLGKGGKGLFALDVTDPNAAGLAASNVFKWERADTPGNHMGLVLGKPFFAKVQGGNTAVVLGNGINSTSERAVLVVLNAETGEVIRQIDTGVGSVTEPNGLSAPTGVLGPDGKTLAYVYAGDMRGNVWKFDLTAANSASWSARRIFTAGTASNVQPISGGVTVATHPRTGKRWVFFGTGRYLTTEDADSTTAVSRAQQAMYGVMENDDGSRVLRTELTQRSLTNTGATMNGFAVRTFDAKAPLPAGSKGWYINLPEQGERIVQDAQVVSTFLITASMVPTGSACEADGSGYINALDAFTGTSAGGSYFDLDGDGRTDDSVVGGRPVGSINPNVGMPTLPNLLRGMLVVGGTTGGMNDPFTLRPEWERVSWREIRRD